METFTMSQYVRDHYNIINDDNKLVENLKKKLIGKDVQFKAGDNIIRRFEIYDVAIKANESTKNIVFKSNDIFFGIVSFTVTCRNSCFWSDGSDHCTYFFG